MDLPVIRAFAKTRERYNAGVFRQSVPGESSRSPRLRGRSLSVSRTSSGRACCWETRALTVLSHGAPSLALPVPRRLSLGLANRVYYTLQRGHALEPLPTGAGKGIPVRLIRAGARPGRRKTSAVGRAAGHGAD